MEPWTSLLLTVGSVAVGVVVAWVFYRKSRDDARRDADAARAIMQRLMERLAAAAPTPVLIAPGAGAVHDAVSLGAPVAVPQVAPETAIAELVLASLSVMQDGRGQVDMRRLLGEIGADVGPERMSDAEEALRELRRRGVVEWQGDDHDLPRIGKLTVTLPGVLT
jgi:hypothetical protein